MELVGEEREIGNIWRRKGSGEREAWTSTGLLGLKPKSREPNTPTSTSQRGFQTGFGLNSLPSRN